MNYKIFIFMLALTPFSAFAAVISTLYATDYEMVAASQTAQKLGPVGGVGDVIKRLIIIPETTGAGTVSIRDGNSNGPAYMQNVLVSGTLSNLSPIVVDLDMRSVSADWNITTGANVHVIAIGKFK